MGNGTIVKKISLPFLVQEFLMIQRRRIGCHLRVKALGVREQRDEETEWLLASYRDIEKRLKETLVEMIKSHPAWLNWLCDVKGINRSPIVVAEIIGGFESAFKEGEGWEHYKTVSQAWSFSGLSVVGGKAPKKMAGRKIPFNDELRSILIGRAAPMFIREKESAYRNYYLQEKGKYKSRFQNEGKKIAPAAKLPINEKRKRYEPADMISKGHLDNMAKRKMLKLFVAHLVEVCWEAEGVPPRVPYVIEKLGHKGYIPPFRDDR